MPVENQTSVQMSKTLAVRREPELQRKKRTAMGPNESFHMKPMEPAMQAKKRVEPTFLKTSPVKSAIVEPVMQSKKRPAPSSTSVLIQPKALPDNVATVEIQSKKKAQPPVSALQSEPPLQSKRRTQGPATTLSNGFYENGVAQNDYALLGNQDKFAANVKYKVRPAQASRDISPPKQMKLQVKEKENSPPAPGPFVDTTQFSKPATPMAPRQPKNQPQAQFKEQKESNVENVKVQKKILKSPKRSESEPRKSERKTYEKVEKLNLDNLSSPDDKPRPTVVKENTVIKDSSLQTHSKPDNTNKDLKKDKPCDMPRKDLTKEVPMKTLPLDASEKDTVKNTKEAVKDDIKAGNTKTVESKNLDLGDPVKDSMKAKRIDNMNEFVQTNMEKGIADSAPEAPADYALRYKTGISAPRPTKKLSEYQKQFAWKAGLPASPLLKAEQVVYNSVPTLSAPKKDVIPKVTEYQKQFKEFPMVPVPKQDLSEPVKHSKRNQLPRSKSMEGLSPAEIPTAGSKPVIAPDNRRLTLESGQKVVEPAPIVPKKKQREYYSEYKSNFKSPTKFDYLRGSWHGADPPQLKIKVPEERAADSHLANWFAEVIELRRKASEYRKRAEGTHFSREHLLQLMAKQTDLWDASTLSARSNLSALSLESGLAGHKSKQDRREVKVAHSDSATIASEDDHKAESYIGAEEGPPMKRQAWADQEDQAGDDYEGSSCRDSEMSSSQKGRLTTPQFRDQVEKEGKQKRRHHLDRTTPCKGGALLSSPPQQKKNRSGKRMGGSSDNGSIVSGSVENGEFEDKPAYRSLAGQRTYAVDTGFITPLPTSGLATKDTHALRDDEASVDRPLPTQYVHSPVRGQRERPGGLDTIGEGFGETYNRSSAGGLPVPRIDHEDDNDDVLSVSMQSIASSCSVASATLERARKRKDEFWGKNGLATR